MMIYAKTGCLRKSGFYIFAHDLIERMHIHVSNTKSRSGKPAKIWLDTLEVFDQGNLTKKEISLALELLANHKGIMKSQFIPLLLKEKLKRSTGDEERWV